MKCKFKHMYVQRTNTMKQQFTLILITLAIDGVTKWSSKIHGSGWCGG